MLFVAVALGAGCKDAGEDDATDATTDDDESFAEDATDTNAAETDAQLLTSSLVSSAATGSVALASLDLDGATGVGTRELPARDGPRAAYLPNGCLTATSEVAAKRVTYTFTRCLIGPAGLRNVSGTVVATYDDTQPNRLALDLRATGLSINDATVDWRATAEILADGPKRTMTWKASLDGTSARQRPFTRTNDQTLSWQLGERCFALEGVSEGEVRKRQVRVQVVSYRRCGQQCPDAGGRVIVTRVDKNKQIEILYDGSASATFIGPKGKAVAVPLLCRAN